MTRLEGWIGFDWDEGNSTKNWIKHQVSAKECEEVFTNRPLLVRADPKHSNVEDRLSVLGQTKSGRTLFISCTLRGKKIRVISARAMSAKEKSSYGQIKEAS